jgi:hypothetical protein
MLAMLVPSEASNIERASTTITPHCAFPDPGADACVISISSCQYRGLKLAYDFKFT